MLFGHALLAAMSADDEALRSVEKDLLTMGAHGESRFVAGLRADCAGDRRAALAAFRSATTQTVYAAPPTREFALACEAQLLDTLGEADLAMERLARAATLTEVRRNADPFLGWSRQGTPIEVLLRRLDGQTSSAWVHALALANSGSAGHHLPLRGSDRAPARTEGASRPVGRPGPESARARGARRARTWLDLCRHRCCVVRLREHGQDPRLQPLRQAGREPTERGARHGTSPSPALETSAMRSRRPVPAPVAWGDGLDAWRRGLRSNCHGPPGPHN